MDDIMDVIWAANYNPYQPFAQLVFPVLGFTPAHREVSIAESKERFWNQHVRSQSSNWFMVVDSDAKKPVGCVQWEISPTDPYQAGVPELKAPWWPDGEHRDFCELILNQTYKARTSWMRRPHIGKWSTSPLE
jgi:hypothetical protein